MDIGMFKGERDNGDAKGPFPHIEDGQARTIQADGAFFDDQVAELFREAETEFPTSRLFLSLNTLSRAVHMSLYDMAVEPTLQGKASFQVYEGSLLPVSEIGFFQGFFNGGDPVKAPRDFFHRQAYAIVGKALFHFQFPGKGGCDPKGTVGALGGNIRYHTSIFDNACEHRNQISDF